MNNNTNNITTIPEIFLSIFKIMGKDGKKGFLRLK